MFLTSMGYHTFTIFLRLTFEEAIALLRAFKKHRDETGEIRIRPMKDKRGVIIPNFHIIEYISESKGLTWTITYNKLLGERPYSIHAKINPKILTGTNDYIAVANADYLRKVEVLFNDEAKNISPILSEFRSYFLNRIDYCLNFDLHELGLNCSPERIMKLIKQSNIPTHFTEWTEYSDSAHKTKADKYSFRLECGSVVVNCYWKYWQLCNEFSDCPNKEDSFNVIRFEIQCYYSKVYSMSKLIRDSTGFSNVKNEMLSDDVSASIIRQYFGKVIGSGDYYTLDLARKMVERQPFTPKRKAKLITALELINSRQGIYNSKLGLYGKELDDFNRSLRELAEIRVNPVTIPKDWGVKRIPNLLMAYSDKLSDEQFKRQQEERRLEVTADYFKALRKKNPKPKKIKELTLKQAPWIDGDLLDG